MTLSPTSLSIDLSSASAPDLSPEAAAAEAPAIALLDLPDGAEALADGTARLTLEWPLSLTLRGGAAPERIETLIFQRLTGAAVRKITDASDARSTSLGLALALGWPENRTAVLAARMDAADMTAAMAVVAALLDGGAGLPDRASIEDGGAVRLPLLVPIGERGEILFHRLTGADLQAIAGSKDTLTTALARAAGIAPAEARALFDELDGADAAGVVRVVGFLSGNGRKTGR